MDIIKLKDGTNIEVKDFQPTNDNLIKVRLHIDNDCTEGIWACLPDEFMPDYNEGVSDEKVFRYATLRNDALNIGPNSWGVIIPVRFDGDNRPECNLSWIDNKSPVIFNLKDT